ncbi:MAG TPA: 5-formyltetrahydrofolate cyclo-ligase [Catenuloplanes sp.]
MPDFSDEAGAIAVGDKPAARAALLAARRALAPPSCAAAAARVQEVLLDLLGRYRPSCVAGYVPVGREPGGADLADVIRAAVGPRGRLLLPVLRPDLDVDWAAYEGPASLTAGQRGVREPVGVRLGRTAVTGADLVVVPALAVDHRGVRLGRGGGSYDRVLARLSGVLTVALLHDGELLDQLPAEAHDRPVRSVITPGGGLTVLPLP